MAVQPVLSVKHSRRDAPDAEARRVPPLSSGDRLSRLEFERRYRAMPRVNKAELVEGVVYMPSPVSAIHSEAHGQIITWLGSYCAATRGVRLSDNATVRLDPDNEVQPDALLRLSPDAGGRARVSQDGFVEGAPELIVEVSATSASYDMHDKLRVYRRNEIQEYIVWRVYDERLDWFELREGEYTPLAVDTDGVTRSRVFPGLWLAVEPLLAGDLPRVLVELQRGVASPDHTAFAERLASAQGGEHVRE